MSKGLKNTQAKGKNCIIELSTKWASALESPEAGKKHKVRINELLKKESGLKLFLTKLKTRG